ncbi:MAG TPA: aminotransferase class I/II-fold pyridoxal phosphate-dependent enzyme, partial [Solirubrobacteraceae bacterium]|nr:aminotransferase class I/II-fold pyridoxal phosphate-dependent enzyme [Solirubrobacteraceae bacterium]
EFPTAVDQVRQPFFCNAAAQAGAVEALRHQDEVARRVERAVAGRLQLAGALEDLGLHVADSQANFVWVHLPEEAEEPEVMRGLTELGVLVRAGGSLGRDNALRVTSGTETENERFLRALRERL